MNNHLNYLGTILLFALLTAHPLPSKAGFFDQMVDSVKKAAEDTFDNVMDQSNNQNSENPPSRNTGQTNERPTRAIAKPSPPSSRQYEPTYDRELVLQIQKRLNVLGINAGTPDGLYGPGTRKAIETFQKQQGLAVNGHPTKTLLNSLNQSIASMAVEQQSATATASSPESKADASISSSKPLPAPTVSAPEGTFSQPNCNSLSEWATAHDSKETIMLAPQVVLSGMFADHRTAPTFGTSIGSWTDNEFKQLSRWLKACRRTASKQKNQTASDNLYKAYKITIPTTRTFTQMQRSRQRSTQAVNNLVGYHRSADLVKVLELADQALHGVDVSSQIKALPVTHSVRGEVLALQHAHGYLTGADIESLSAVLSEGTSDVKQEMAAKNEKFEALKQQLEQVPMTHEGAYTLDRILKDPVLAKVSQQESMDFRNAVMKKRMAISQAVRQKKKQEKAAAAAVPVDVVSRLQRLFSGDDVRSVSLQGIKPGIPYLYAKKFTSTRFGMKAATGGDLFKEFTPTGKQISQYKQAERRDGGLFQLETMKDTVGQVKFIEHYTGVINLKDPGIWLQERFGKADEFKFLGDAVVMKWKEGGMNLSVMPANRTALQYRSSRDYKSSLVITLWSDEYKDYLIAAQTRCKELRNKPAKDLSVQDKMDILQGCKD